MKYKVAFLDRDGTINVEKNYLYKISDFEFLPGVIEGLKALQDNGYLLVIITNQSGIGRGYYTVEDIEHLHQWMIEQLKMHGISVSGIYFCPHLPDAQVEKYRCVCECRKPKTGMYWKAIHDLSEVYELDLKNSVAIGDNERDLSICSEIGMRGILLGHKCNLEQVHTANDFKAAVKWILSNK